MKNQKTLIILLTAIGSIIFLNSCQEEKAKTGQISSYEQLIQYMQDPPAEYRSAPLWDWNEDISKEGIDLHMEAFNKAGIGGVFVHPRPGLITEYLSDNWHELFDYTVKKGEELGMNVWIYDENSYPSGFAGGHVPAQMPDSYKHGAGLSFSVAEVLEPSVNDSFEVVLEETENGFRDITSEYTKKTGEKGKFYLFTRTFPGESPWYGGFSYIDLLYPGVTQKFLDITMKGYRQYNQKDFTHTLKGIFTDEPNLEAAMTRNTVLRWTPDLWDEFEKRWGYDLKVHLPSLVHETGDWKKVRHDYYELILELFIDRWAKICSEYCEEQGLIWTGHYWEHGWPLPTHGFDEAAFYIWHQQPGIDMLGSQLIPEGQGSQFGNTRAVRELQSAANQAGRKRTLSETYGGGGWEMDFYKFKQLADWQCVFGVNFVNQHLSYYSLKGVRKFDYPPSFSYHEPWWENYRIMGDYLARISMATAAGEQLNKILVLQPNTTAWMYFSRVENNPYIKTIQHDFKGFVHELEKNHIEYDLGSENVLKETGSVSKGKLIVGARAYDLIIIPKEMENLDSTTFDLLKNYLKQGGKVISFRKNIERLDGSPSEELNQLEQKFPGQWIFAESIYNDSIQDLFKADDFVIQNATDNQELFHQRRILDDGQLIFVVNSQNTGTARAVINSSAKAVRKIDLFTGEEKMVPSVPAEEGIKFEIELSPVESALYYLSDNDSETESIQSPKINKTKIDLNNNVRASVPEDNILVIDYLDLKTGKSEQENVHFMKALISLYKENGIEFGNPWQHKIQYKQKYVELDTLFNDNSGFEVSYHFEISDNLNADVMKNIRAVIERPELWKVLVNGREVNPLEGEYWIDREFPVIDIGDYIHSGKNTITLSSNRMSIFAEIMPVYILGNFSLHSANHDFIIVNQQPFGTGSWIDAGMPFYSQKVAYNNEFESSNEFSGYTLRLNNWNGTVSEVFINDEKAGVIAWPPYELDISRFVDNGTNNIEVRVIGSLKNTFGYFYHPNDRWIHGPHEWNRAPDKKPGLTGMYLVDYGLFDEFEVYGHVNEKH